MITYYGPNSLRKFTHQITLRVAGVVVLLAVLFFTVIIFEINKLKPPKRFAARRHRFLEMEQVIVPANFALSAERNARCSYYTCFNPYKCGLGGMSQIQVYVYPMKYFLTEKKEPIVRSLTREFDEILETVKRSKYYTSDPDQACIFIPPFDTLSQTNIMVKQVSQALNMLPQWNNGENHLIFNLFPPKNATVIDLSIGNAMVAGAGFDSWTYRPSFDISLPPYSPLKNISVEGTRSWLILSSQMNVHSSFVEKFEQLSGVNSELIMLHSCPDSDLSFRCHRNGTRYKYPEVLGKSVFCLIFRGSRLSQPALLEAMAYGCIPIVFSDTFVMPFQEVIDWNRAAFVILENNLNSVIELAKSVSSSRVDEMFRQCSWLYSKYFSSIEAVTNTTLLILNQRVFPENAFFYEDWNIRPDFIGARSPLFLQSKSFSTSFTAVVLTYDRLESLFTLIQKLALVPSLSMILVVWNNPRKTPPESSKWPQINKTLKVVRTRENKLSNRFFPYKEIETEAILSLDDDISMLTEDELDFGFEVWREFPDRIIGFPSRTHVWDNVSLSWKYESEWTNEISMVLTGAAFYHKYWNYLYTTSVPEVIHKWVDSHMNCEDIAMNFLVSNVTNKAPIKVTPRKKFKCPECTGTEMLSADFNHMQARSKCINKFMEVYGRLPLRKVEFRADPVLFKDNLSPKLKRFKNIGSL